MHTEIDEPDSCESCDEEFCHHGNYHIIIKTEDLNGIPILENCVVCKSCYDWHYVRDLIYEKL